MFPVVRIERPFMGETIVLHAAMMDCPDAESAVAQFPKEPGDRVIFAWWDIPRPPIDPP